MSLKEKAIARAFGELGDQLARLLDDVRKQDSGRWRRLPSARATDLVFVKPTGDDGTCAVAYVTRGSFSFHKVWPVDVSLRFGVSHEPAIALKPVVTLAPYPILIEESELDPDREPADEDADDKDEGHDDEVVKLRGERDVPRVARTLADVILVHDLSMVEPFDSVEAIDEYLRTDRLIPLGDVIELRPLLLAAAGRHEEARRTLDDYLAHARTGRRHEPEYQRFARRLRRWLDTGVASVPPIEETLWLVPPLRRPTMPGFGGVVGHAHAIHTAEKEVRDVSRGTSQAEIIRLLTAEYDRRGVSMSSIRIARKAKAMAAAEPAGLGGLGGLGGLLKSLRRIDRLASVVGQAVDLVKRRDEPDPGWLRPPERATYEVDVDQRRYLAVTLAPDARPWLARVAAEAPRRVDDVVQVDVWLRRGAGDDVPDDATIDDTAGPIVVHIGERAVGTVPAAHVRDFADDFARSAFFDELPRMSGTLALDVGPEPILEMKLPWAT